MSNQSEKTKRLRTKDTTLYEKTMHGQQIIRLPFSQDMYSEIVNCPIKFRSYIDEYIYKFPELLPTKISEGYDLHDIRYSKRQKLHYRRIEINGKKYTVQPSFIMPYWTSKSDDVWYPLLLIQYGVPYWLITMQFGHTDDFWYRLFCHLGRFNIVGTTARRVGEIPTHLVSDEKISWWNGQEIYICTTASAQCLWGAAPSLREDAEGLTQGYGVFMAEAKEVEKNYNPESVNTDGWPSLRKAWQTLCSNIILIRCFLHAYLKIRQSAKRLESKKELFTFIWDAYKEETQEGFVLKINELGLWATKNISHQPTLENVQKLCERVDEYALAYKIPKAYRTSNMVDRPMRRMDRFLFTNQYFHGHFASAQLLTRAFALSYNFMPFCPRSQKYNLNRKRSRAAAYNKFEYSENWLENLLISGSLNGIRS